MAKGQQRSNREFKKPKKSKPAPSAPGSSSGRPPAKGNTFIPGAGKR